MIEPNPDSAAAIHLTYPRVVSALNLPHNDRVILTHTLTREVPNTGTTVYSSPSSSQLLPTCAVLYRCIQSNAIFVPAFIKVGAISVQHHWRCLTIYPQAAWH